MRPSFSLLALALAACSTSTTADAGTDAATDAAACPATQPTTGSDCALPSTLTCTYGPVCAACFAFTYTMESPMCSCSGGRWVCDHVDCLSGACHAGIYDDPMCTVPCTPPPDAGGTDAGGTDAGATDAGSTFACGPTLTCARQTTYCRILMGGPVGATPSYSCEPAPMSCVPVRCACVSFGGGDCTDDGMGGVTQTINAP